MRSTCTASADSSSTFAMRTMASGSKPSAIRTIGVTASLRCTMGIP